MISIMRKRWLAITVAVVTVALLVVTMQSALAASRTWQSMEGDTDSAGTWPDGQSYGTEGIGVPNDSYHINMGHWNKASQGPISMTFDDASATNAYQITEWADPVPSGSSFDFSTSTSVVAWNGSEWIWSTEDQESDDGDDEDDGVYESEASSNFHAPAAYPSFVQGCHWGQCTWDTTNDGYENAGIPYPIRARDITNLNSTFGIGVDANADSGVWNASFDIWLDTGTRLIQPGWTNQYPPDGQPDMPYEDYVGWPMMPGFPGALMQYDEDDQRGQNDGAEIMIWMNNRGYGHGDGNPIRPAGTAAGMIGTAVPIAIPGDPDAKWDIWVGRSGAAGYPNWNVISYVKVNDINGANPNTLSMNFDANTFIQHAISLNNCPTVSGREGNPNGAVCVHPDWWLTSVQAGFEIWDKGAGLSVTEFSVKPNINTDQNTAKVDTGFTYTGTDGVTVPLIHWIQKFVLRYETACDTSTVTATISDNDPNTTEERVYNLVKVADNVDGQIDLWAVRAGPVFDLHNLADATIPGVSTVTFTTGCGTPEVVDIYIDPSGVVVNT
ncbi:MAG: hypothetical protein JXB07_17035, partial [Anaerolineae bacterium]|nr:hypothetical protein [Anaerolineae bacterium]